MSIDSLRSGAIRICFDPSLNAYPNKCRILLEGQMLDTGTAADGVPIKEIVRRLGVASNTVRAALSSDRPPQYRRPLRGSVVDAYEPQIRAHLWGQRRDDRNTAVRCPKVHTP